MIHKFETVLERVLETKTLKEAAQSLSMSNKELQHFLSQRIPHKRGQRWSISVKNYLESKKPRKVTMSDSPAEIIRVVAESLSLKESAEKLETDPKILKKFLVDHIEHEPRDYWRTSARKHLGLEKQYEDIWDL